MALNPIPSRRPFEARRDAKQCNPHPKTPALPNPALVLGSPDGRTLGSRWANCSAWPPADPSLVDAFLCLASFSPFPGGRCVPLLGLRSFRGPWSPRLLWPDLFHSLFFPFPSLSPPVRECIRECERVQAWVRCARGWMVNGGPPSRLQQFSPRSKTMFNCLQCLQCLHNLRNNQSVIFSVLCGSLRLMTALYISTRRTYHLNDRNPSPPHYLPPVDGRRQQLPKHGIMCYHCALPADATHLLLPLLPLSTGHVRPRPRLLLPAWETRNRRQAGRGRSYDCHQSGLAKLRVSTPTHPHNHWHSIPSIHSIHRSAPTDTAHSRSVSRSQQSLCTPSTGTDHATIAYSRLFCRLSACSSGFPGLLASCPVRSGCTAALLHWHCPSVRLSVCPAIWPSGCLAVCPSVCVNVSMCQTERRADRCGCNCWPA